MNTNDLMDFGYRELHAAGRILLTLKTKNDETRFLGSQVKLEFNPNSGNVFLVDDDFNVAMMNGDKLEDFFTCPECGHEGFIEDMKHEGGKGCREYLKQIKEN